MSVDGEDGRNADGDLAVGTTPDDERVSDDQLLYAGMGLTYIVAAIHLFHPSSGFPRLVEIAIIGQPSLLVTDPRPIAFVLSAFLLIVGANLVLAGKWRRPLLLLGMLVVASYFLGYFLWHLTGHGSFLPGRQAVHTGLSPIENVLVHITGDLFAMVSKLLEATLLVVLGSLYRRESE